MYTFKRQISHTLATSLYRQLMGVCAYSELRYSNRFEPSDLHANAILSTIHIFLSLEF